MKLTKEVKEKIDNWFAQRPKEEIEYIFNKYVEQEQLRIGGVVKSLPTKRDFILWNAPKNAVKDGLLIDENWIDDEENLHHEIFEDFINWWATQK